MSVCVGATQTSQRSAKRDKLLSCLIRSHFIETQADSKLKNSRRMEKRVKEATLCILINQDLSRRTVT